MERHYTKEGWDSIVDPYATLTMEYCRTTAVLQMHGRGWGMKRQPSFFESTSIDAYARWGEISSHQPPTAEKLSKHDMNGQMSQWLSNQLLQGCKSAITSMLVTISAIADTNSGIVDILEEILSRLHMIRIPFKTQGKVWEHVA
jgi:hypothetical protein